MIWPFAKLSPGVRALLDRERTIAVLPTATRARALARARAALAAGVPARPIPSRARMAIPWAAAAGLICLATVAAGAAAYEIAVRARPTAPPVAESPAAVTAWPVIDLPPAARARRSAISTDQAARQELRLLQQAHAAVAQDDFGAALRLLAEHARRFKTGRLVEEREALHVRALAGLGRRDDARRAAASFKARFPLSPLLPAVGQMPDAAPY